MDKDVEQFTFFVKMPVKCLIFYKNCSRSRRDLVYFLFLSPRKTMLIIKTNVLLCIAPKLFMVYPHQHQAYIFHFRYFAYFEMCSQYLFNQRFSQT